MIVPFGFLFHCGVSVGQGFFAFRAIDLHVMLRLFSIYFVVLSPSVKCVRRGVVLREGRFLRGRLSDSLLSIVYVASSSESLYWMSRLSSESPSLLQNSSFERTSFLSSFLSKQLLISSLYDRFWCDGFVTMFEIRVFGSLSKCASNGVVFISEFGISLMFSMLFASLSLKNVLDQFGSTSETAKRRLIVWIGRSTMPVPRWSPVGANIIFKFFCIYEIF